MPGVHTRVINRGWFWLRPGSLQVGISLIEVFRYSPTAYVLSDRVSIRSDSSSFRDPQRKCGTESNGAVVIDSSLCRQESEITGRCRLFL